MLQVVCAFLPAEPTQVAAGVVFGFPVGFACCAVGVAIGNTLIYLLYKTYGDGIRQYFVKNLDFDLETAANSSRSVLIIFLLYFLPAIPYGMICFFAASIGMKYRRFIVVTVLGSVPSICIGVGLGHMTLATSWIISVCVFAVLVALIILLSIKRDWFFAKVNALAAKPKKQKNGVKKCNLFLLGIVYLVVGTYFRLSGIRVKTVNKYDKPLEKPCIILCNHGSFIDFYYAAKLIGKNGPNFIAARLYFYHKWLGFLLRNLGAFPKSMFATDLESTKNCIKVLKSGGLLAMMPEARLSTVGEFEDIQQTTYSFLKKSAVPVYTIKICGDYFADPKWGKGFRKGALVEAELDLLFTAEQVKEMSIEEIKSGVESRLYYDEFEWLETRPQIKYKSEQMAQGLENILSICPVCKSKYTITTKGNEVFCEKCGKLTEIDNRYAFDKDFKFKNFKKWYEWQKQILEDEILKDQNYSLCSKVELRLPSKDGKSLTRSAGEGVCTLNREGLKYVGTKDGETVEISFSIERIYRLLFGAGENFEIYNGSEILYFVPKEKRSAVEWYLTSMIMYDIKFSN
ncbi:MAG: hypothetical protein E7537_04100, partial [Ruminococcaceae bacterium]|nr:hypothetical protein [Oscillospiraceae bacterium]